jgi:RNA polymerase sigma factor (sigma-70 family)
MSEASVSRTGRRVRAVPFRLRSDDRLARDAASGDAAAFAALYERHHQPLYRYCRSIVADPEDAADALQSTMTRAWAAIAERDPAAPVRAWLFRIAHNESISLVRRRRPTEELDAESLVSPDAAADAHQRRRLAELVRDLHGLSERQRGALLMRVVSGLGHAEIATVLGVSEGAVKQSIYEARVALQDLADGREMSCSAVRRALSDGDGRTARSRRLRGHLRSCEDCRAFRDTLRTQRSELALIAPMLPAGAAAAVLEAVLGGGSIGGGGLLAGLLGGGATKAVAVGAATVTAGAGAVTFTAVVPVRDARDAVDETVERQRGTGGGGGAEPRSPAAVAAPVAQLVDNHDESPRGDGRGDDRGTARRGRSHDNETHGSSGRGPGRKNPSDDPRGSSGSGTGSAGDDSSGRGGADESSGHDRGRPDDDDSSGTGGGSPGSSSGPGNGGSSHGGSGSSGSGKGPAPAAPPSDDDSSGSGSSGSDDDEPVELEAEEEDDDESEND